MRGYDDGRVNILNYMRGIMRNTNSLLHLPLTKQSISSSAAVYIFCNKYFCPQHKFIRRSNIQIHEFEMNSEFGGTYISVAAAFSRCWMAEERRRSRRQRREIHPEECKEVPL